MAQAPNCGKCGKAHFNFTKCSSPQVKEKRTPYVVRQPREDSLIDWRDKMSTFKKHGDSLRLKDRVYARPLGTMTPPSGWTPPEERK